MSVTSTVRTNLEIIFVLRETLCKHVIPVNKKVKRKKWIGKIQRAEGILIRMRLRYSRAKEFVLLLIDVLVISVIFRTSVQTLPVRKCLKYEWKITFFCLFHFIFRVYFNVYNSSRMNIIEISLLVYFMVLLLFWQSVCKSIKYKPLCV